MLRIQRNIGKYSNDIKINIFLGLYCTGSSFILEEFHLEQEQAQDYLFKSRARENFVGVSSVIFQP